MVAEHGCPHVAECILDVLVPPIMEEIAKVVKTVLQEQISEGIRKQIVDVCVSQIVEQATEVPKTSSRDRTLQRAVEQILDVPVPEMVTQLLEVPKIIPQDRILQRTVKQAETSGADGQTYSLFQESSSAALQTSTDLQGFEMVISVRRLAEQEHSTALDQLASRISAIMKFGAGADGDPFVKVKDLITDLISRLQAEASSETNQKSYCDEEMSKATEKREDLETDVAKHSSKLEAAVARSIDLDGEISALQSVQHVVNTAEVETPRIIKEAIRGRKSVIREKINQVTEHIRNPQIPYMKKVDDMPVAVQRQIPMVQTVQETKEIPQLRCTDEVVDNLAEQVPRVQVLEKTAEIPQLQTVEKIGETPQTQMIQSARTSESSVTDTCLSNDTGGNWRGDRNWSVNPCRIRVTHIRHSTRLGKFSSCCWV